MPGSPAINAGSNALAVDAQGNPLTTDQRGTGFPRIVDGTVDIGAFEAPVPSSSVSALPKSETSLSFTVSVAGSDAPTASPTGVSTFDIYSSTNGGPWAFWTSVPASSPSATFTGQSNTIYAFYSIAHDLAGYTEIKSPRIEASTYVPDLTPPVTSVNPTTGTNPSTVDPATDTFTINLTRTAPGGTPLAYFELFVGIDLGGGGNTQQIGAAVPAGFPDAHGVYHATITYQGITDGTSHSYTFSSLGINGAGLAQGTPVNPVTFSNQSFTATTLEVTALTVEHGAAERSYIRYLDIGFNESDSQSGGQLTQIAGSVGTADPLIQLYKYNLSGTPSSKTPVSLQSPAVLEVIDHAIEIDFGAAGIGEVAGSNNTTATDGYYELDVTVGSTTYKHDFYRLLGDVTGDGVVDNNDLTAIATELTLSAPTGYTPLSADINGDGSVTAFDVTLATRAKGHKLGAGLPLG